MLEKEWGREVVILIMVIVLQVYTDVQTYQIARFKMYNFCMSTTYTSVKRVDG